MLLLSLGFPARNHYERAAQRAIHRFHWLVLKRLALISLLFIPIIILVPPFAWLFIGGALLLILTPLAFLSWWGHSSQDRSLEHFVYRSGFSEELAVLCARTGIRPIEVFSALSVEDVPGARILRVEGEWRVLTFRGEVHSFTRRERQGVLAHELGHLLLPLGFLVNFIGGARIFHEREFAVDTIGACILSDARPILFCLRKVSEASLDLGFPVGAGPTHPAFADRINQLLDIEFDPRRAR